ncbi:unnamed protein product [Durusdinium trenchii]|uniref:Uncharacterized protein n=1 Tax=Durusdinium trenchii TaxID=1381693 RepID=A0ABP0RFP2_9DINO
MPTPAPEPPTSDARRLGRSFPSDLEELLGTPKASQNQPSQTERSFQKSPHVAFHFGISHGMRVLELVLPLASWALDPREPPAAALAALTAAVGNDTQNDALTLAGALPVPLSLASLGSFLRLGAGLSAWKSYDGVHAWALRMAPSSGTCRPLSSICFCLRWRVLQRCLRRTTTNPSSTPLSYGGRLCRSWWRAAFWWS